MGEELAVEARGFEVEVVGFVGGFVDGGAGAAGAEEGFETGEGFEELIGIAEGGLEEAELMVLRAGGLGAESDGDDGGVGLEVFQMRVEHAEKGVHVSRGRGDGEGALVGSAGGELERELQFLRD